MTFARFAASPIGSGLAAEDGGLTLSPNAAGSLARAGRSDIALDSGNAGAEFVFWGEDDQEATIGVLTPAASLSAEVGSVAGGIGWRLHAGTIVAAGTVVATGLPVPNKGEIVGLRVALSGGTRTIAFYRGGTQVHSRTLSLTGAVHLGVSLASTEAGGLRCILNAGQWQGISPAILDGGWQLPAASVAPHRLGTEDYMSAPSDSPANTAWAGIVAAEGLDTVASVNFWPWAGSSRAGVGSLKLYDAEGLLDAAALGDVRDVPVAVRRVVQGQPLSTSTPVARFVLERIDIEDDGRKSVILRDPHDDLDKPLHQAVFLPSISDQIAWQPQPVVIGAVRSLPVVPVNSDGSVAWLADAPLTHVERVLDRGAAIVAGDGYTLVGGGQQLAFDSPPVGPVVVDASSIGASMQPATLEQCLKAVFGRVKKTSWASADAAAIDTDTGYAGVGYYAADGGTPRQALAAILPSYCADVWQDGDGVLRLARLIDPASVADGALAYDLDWRELGGDLACHPDLAPNLSRRMYYQPNAEVLGGGDLITDMAQLPVPMRQLLTSEYRGQVYAGGPLAARYVRAEAAAPVPSRFDRRADAQAEINRVVGLYAVPRHFYDARINGRQDLYFMPGQVVRLTYPRYGLQAGRKLLVVSAIGNPVAGRHTVRFWGA